jgi:hypothetical protein
MPMSENQAAIQQLTEWILKRKRDLIVPIFFMIILSSSFICCRFLKLTCFMINLIIENIPLCATDTTNSWVLPKSYQEPFAALSFKRSSRSVKWLRRIPMISKVLPFGVFSEKCYIQSFSW